MLESAYAIVSAANYGGNDDMKTIVKKYQDEDYRIDSAYRKFYFYLDRIANSQGYEQLQTLVGQIPRYICRSQSSNEK